MITRSVEALIGWLITKEVIGKESEELYKYAAMCLVTSAYPILLTMIIGICMGKLVESVLIIIPFMCIRKYGGGYHAKTMLICFIESCCLLILCIGMTFYIKCSVILHLSLMVAAVTIYVCSPIDSENRRLDMEERRRYRTITRIIAAFFIFVYFCLYFLHQDTYAVCIALGIILTAGMQLRCIVQLLQRNSK